MPIFFTCGRIYCEYVYSVTQQYNAYKVDSIMFPKKSLLVCMCIPTPHICKYICTYAFLFTCAYVHRHVRTRAHTRAQIPLCGRCPKGVADRRTHERTWKIRSWWDLLASSALLFTRRWFLERRKHYKCMTIEWMGGPTDRRKDTRLCRVAWSWLKWSRKHVKKPKT